MCKLCHEPIHFRNLVFIVEFSLKDEVIAPALSNNHGFNNEIDIGKLTIKYWLTSYQYRIGMRKKYLLSLLVVFFHWFSLQPIDKIKQQQQSAWVVYSCS